IAAEIQVRRPETPSQLPQLARGMVILRLTTIVVACVALFAVGTRDGRPLAVALVAIAVLTDAALIRPLRSGPAERMVASEFDWLRSAGLADRPIVTAHVFADYLANVSA